MTGLGAGGGAQWVIDEIREFRDGGIGGIQPCGEKLEYMRHVLPHAQAHRDAACCGARGQRPRVVEQRLGSRATSRRMRRAMRRRARAAAQAAARPAR
ncbi:hypothetical protein, partial [Bordetella pertussis]|uniref:hypothetical protein n=1 Tax=Bordetella pertussis TaxID=520 RepID=UPI001C9E440C